MKKLIGIMLAVALVIGIIHVGNGGKPATTGMSMVTSALPDRDYWPTSGWRQAAPETRGMDAVILARADSVFGSEFPDAFSLLVVHNGYMVLERYCKGAQPDSAMHVFSITKTVVSALMGICAGDGLIDGPDQKLADFFPEYFTEDVEPARKAITLRQALSHSSGLEPSRVTDDHYGAIIQGPLAYAPGTAFQYSNSVPDLLSGIITKVTGSSAFDFGQDRLFGPLGMHVTRWDTDSTGNNQGGGGIWLTPRDMARLGYLYLNGGMWDGMHLLPAEWVAETMKPQMTIDNRAYGFLMWVRPENPRDCYLAYPYGHRGQYIGIIPSLDLVVVMTSDTDVDTRGNDYIQELIQDYVARWIVPAVLTDP